MKGKEKVKGKGDFMLKERENERTTGENIQLVEQWQAGGEKGSSKTWMGRKLPKTCMQFSALRVMRQRQR